MYLIKIICFFIKTQKIASHRIFFNFYYFYNISFIRSGKNILIDFLKASIFILILSYVKFKANITVRKNKKIK